MTWEYLGDSGRVRDMTVPVPAPGLPSFTPLSLATASYLPSHSFLPMSNSSALIQLALGPSRPGAVPHTLLTSVLDRIKALCSMPDPINEAATYWRSIFEKASEGADLSDMLQVSKIMAILSQVAPGLDFSDLFPLAPQAIPTHGKLS